MKIKIENLRFFFEGVMEKLSHYDDELEIDMDLYPFITPSDWEAELGSFRKTNLTVGSLLDDWDSLQKKKEENESLTFVDFDRLAFILLAISQELNPPVQTK